MSLLIFFDFSRAKIATGLILGKELPLGTESEAMNDPHDPNETVADDRDPNQTVDAPSSPIDSLDVGLAAAFGRSTPRPSLGFKQTVLLKEAEGESSLVVKPQSDAMPTREEAGDRYRLDGEIARGGMGVVLRGRDVDLGRDLAVKVLLDRYANRPDISRRFIEEAQIGGQLQHPGVVPVYDIGRFGDRPFFTMKLVKGQTLAAILGERNDLATDRPRLLSIALQVAQAMAYAHAKGVIHRDLKPANIMVGSFGEVQVMDWGLAKVLGEGGVADEERASRAHQEPDQTTIRTARSTGSHGSFGTDTEAGSILGTPAYMPPEQAGGDIPNLDRRADVFALGAILCEILTGKPPYVGRFSEEVRRKAANGDLADATARLDACGADAELIALTKMCLFPEAIHRPKDAQAVADSLTSYLDGVQERLQTAERERAVAAARQAEQRKRRKVQLALAAAVVCLVLGGGSFAWWQNEQTTQRRETDLRRQLADEQRAAADNARLARNAEAVSGLLVQAEEALKADDAAKAAVALEAAKKRSTEGGAEKETERLRRLDADLALLRDLNAVDQFGWTAFENHLPNPMAVAVRTREALKQFGADPDATSVGEAATRVSASVVRERIVAALDRLLRNQKTAGVRALLRLLDADPYRNALRDAVHADDVKRMVELAGQSAALDQPPLFVAFLGDSTAIPVERRRQLLRAAVTRRSGDLSLLMSLGNSFPFNKKEAVHERLRWFQAAVAAAPGNAAVLINLGAALTDNGQWDEAIASYHKAIELDPKNAMAHNNLAAALHGQGRLDEAFTSIRKAVELDPNHAWFHNSLGISLHEHGQSDEAIASYKKAIELDPKFPQARYQLGVALQDRGQFDEALACYKKAIDLDPRYATAHCNVGIILQIQGRLDEAIASYKKAIDLDPTYAKFHYNLGYGLQTKGRLDEAMTCYQQVIGLDPTYAEAHCNTGVILQLQGRLAESLEAFRKGHELGSKRAAWRYPSAEWVRQAESRVALEAKLPAFLKGEFHPIDNTQRLALAGICHMKKLNQSAADLYAAAFAADPKLADNLPGQRYNAACFAATAAAGQGEGAAKLDDRERGRLRKQALDWLRAELALRTKQLDSANPKGRAAQPPLHHWRIDPDLASIREAAALAKLPETERKEWEGLWSEVENLLKRAEGRKP